MKVISEKIFDMGEDSLYNNYYEEESLVEKCIPAGMITIPKTLAREVHDALVSSRKIREEYKLNGVEYTEILYKELRKWMER